MKRQTVVLGGALSLALAGCVPPLAADYTEVEAPKTITLDNASSRVVLRFQPGSGQLVPADAARLRSLAASGYIAPGDRVTIALSGPPGLGNARFTEVSGLLASYRIVALRASVGALRPNEAVLDTGRYLVTLPPCPNWSKTPSMRYTNTYSSNFGCASAVNLGRMVWHPADLVEGVPHEPSYTPTPDDTTGATHSVIVPASAAVALQANNPANFTNGDISDALRVLPPPPAVSGANGAQTSQNASTSFLLPAAPTAAGGAPPPTGGR